MAASTTNPYSTHPLFIALANTTSGRFIRAFYFLGAVPKLVLAAARRVEPMAKDSRKPDWSPADAAILRGHYGNQWRELLTPDDPPAQDTFGLSAASTIPTFFTGGATIDFGNLDDIDAPIDATTSIKPISYEIQAPVSGTGPPIYTDIAVYPEDTIYTLQLKLSLASGIPFYRQHFFYYVNDEGPVTPYRFTLDSAPVLTDWRAMRATSSTSVAGMSIDTRFEDHRDGIHIAALNTFTLLSPVVGVRVTRAYFVDLFSVLPPLNTSERPNDGLATILRDRYQFDLLYYGGIVRYWPHLSPDAANAALSNPNNIADAYPTLEPDLNTLRTKFNIERTLADIALKWQPRAKHTVAVTAATVRILPNAARMRVAIRNVFDWIPTSIHVAAARAKFDIEASTLTDAGITTYMARQGGLLPVVTTKRHVSSFGPKATTTIDQFVDQTSEHATVSYALTRKYAIDAGQIPYAFLMLHVDGHMEATAEWREDDRIDFETAITEVATIITPMVNNINAMGPAAFPIGGKLFIESTGHLTTLGEMTVSTFWPHALSTAAFREVKTRFRSYEKSDIVTINSLQRASAYTFTFRKGVVTYDQQLADIGLRKTEEQRIQNQYAWMTDTSIAPRWANAFQGRTVRIYHRATDLRIEFVNVDNLIEFEIIRRYIFSFLDELLIGPDKISTSTAITRTTKDETPHRLKRLQERDPNLFDLKKYDQGATVYSVLCQSGRQPQIYNDADLDGMNTRQRAALVKYWNFTEEKPAYYECPDPKYPYLNLRGSQHPLGYCLPCCKKTKPIANSRAALINSSCLKQHTFTHTADDDASSRHILSYGKPIPVGRISETAHEIKEGIFLEVIPAPYQFQMIGVEQSTPAVPEAGFAYALAYALSISNDSIDVVLTDLANTAAEMGETYYTLGNGAGVAFASARELASVIMTTFVHRATDLGPFSPGGIAADTWQSILTDLARYAYGTEIVTFVDSAGIDSITIEASTAAVSTIMGSPDVRIALLSISPSGTYPIVALNPKAFLRIDPINRWMVVRRAFEGIIPEDDKDVYAVDTVVETIRSIFATGMVSTTAIDLEFITRWVVKAGFTIEMKLINLHNLCYGVILRNLSGIIYIPIHHSAYSPDGIEAIFDPRPEDSTPSQKTLDGIVDSINQFINDNEEPYTKITKSAIITNAEGLAIGFTTTGEVPLYFYHVATVVDSGSGMSIINFPYDSREIDTAILETMCGNTSAPVELPTAIVADIKNKLYKLFTAEFSAVLRAERNTALRSRLTSALKATQYESAKSIATLRHTLVEILGGFPEDLHIVRNAIARAYIVSPHDPGKTAMATIDATSFVFDRQLMAQLRALKTHKEIVQAVTEIMAPRIIIQDIDPTQHKLSNMYVSCAEGSTLTANSLCARKQLIIPMDRITDFYDILAADIRNPSKTNLLAAVSAGAFDPLEFIQHSGEQLTVLIGG